MIRDSWIYRNFRIPAKSGIQTIDNALGITNNSGANSPATESAESFDQMYPNANEKTPFASTQKGFQETNIIVNTD